MPRRFITCKQNDFNYDLSDCSCVILRQESLVDNFYYQENECTVTGGKTVCFTDPLIMLFNQERLSQMGGAAVKMWLDSLSHSTSSPMSELRSKLSDDDLMALVKSRHIQNPSELQAYAEWCNENIAELQTIVDKAKAETESKPVEPTVNPVDSTPKSE